MQVENFATLICNAWSDFSNFCNEYCYDVGVLLPETENCNKYVKFYSLVICTTNAYISHSELVPLIVIYGSTLYTLIYKYTQHK